MTDVSPIAIALVVLGAVAATMAAEQRRSARHGRRLRARGAIEPPDDVFRRMRLVYPGAFVGMAVEGVLTGVAVGGRFGAGVAIWLAAKALKYWAVAALGERWTFRVLVPPDATLVRHGPYRWMRHPNYVAVVGELVGMAVMMAAPVSGAVAIVGFGELIRRRIVVERRALGL